MRIQQISQGGKEYLKAAETLLRAARTMTDRAIAGQLKALADDYERRAGSPHAAPLRSIRLRRCISRRGGRPPCRRRAPFVVSAKAGT